LSHPGYGILLWQPELIEWLRAVLGTVGRGNKENRSRILELCIRHVITVALNGVIRWLWDTNFGKEPQFLFEKELQTNSSKIKNTVLSKKCLFRR